MPGDTQQGNNNHERGQDDNNNTLIIPSINKDEIHPRIDLLSHSQKKIAEYNRLKALLPRSNSNVESQIDYNTTPDFMLSKDTKSKREKDKKEIERQHNIKDIVKGLEYLDFVTGEAMNIINSMLMDPDRLKNDKSVEYYKELEDKKNQRFFQEMMINIIIIESLKEDKGIRFFDKNHTQENRLELLAKTLTEITQDPTIKISNKGATGLAQIQPEMYKEVTGRIGKSHYFDISDNRFQLNMKYNFPIAQKNGLHDPIISSVVAILLNYMNYKDIITQLKSKITTGVKNNIKTNQQKLPSQLSTNNAPVDINNNTQGDIVDKDTNSDQMTQDLEDISQENKGRPEDIIQDTSQEITQSQDTQVQDTQSIESNLNTDKQSAQLNEYISLTKYKIEDEIKRVIKNINLQGIKTPRDLEILLVANYNGSSKLL